MREIISPSGSIAMSTDPSSLWVQNTLGWPRLTTTPLVSSSSSGSETAVVGNSQLRPAVVIEPQAPMESRASAPRIPGIDRSRQLLLANLVIKTSSLVSRRPADLLVHELEDLLECFSG